MIRFIPLHMPPAPPTAPPNVLSTRSLISSCNSIAASLAAYQSSSSHQGCCSVEGSNTHTAQCVGVHACRVWSGGVPAAACSTASHGGPQVSPAQRRLLEKAMGRMGRVPVWALMSGSAANINVFVVTPACCPIFLPHHR
jgi:hypothetical protein